MINVRKAVKEDLPAVLELYKQPDMDDGHVLAIEEAERIFERMQNYPDYAIYVAELDGQIVGTFALAILDNLAHMGVKSALVEDVVVSPEFQRHGIGRQMMRSAMALCKEKGCYKLALSSNVKRENAHRFYEKLGFRIQGYSFWIDLD